jgi:hypothetical protein
MDYGFLYFFTSIKSKNRRIAPVSFSGFIGCKAQCRFLRCLPLLGNARPDKKNGAIIIKEMRVFGRFSVNVLINSVKRLSIIGQGNASHFTAKRLHIVAQGFNPVETLGYALRPLRGQILLLDMAVNECR